MRINKFVAQATALSRRAADQAIVEGKVMINGESATAGADVADSDIVKLNGRVLSLPAGTLTIRFNKPAGYVCSRAGQGNPTIYDLLPAGLHHLKPVGRLDKDSSGLLLLTNDGDLANRLTHPRYAKTKVYEVGLNEPLVKEDDVRLRRGVELEDGLSKLRPLGVKGRNLTVILSEGRNRQIRRTFAALGYRVTSLHRIRFGQFELGDLTRGRFGRVE